MVAIVRHADDVAAVTQALRNEERARLFMAADNTGVPRSDLLDATEVTYQTARTYLEDMADAGLVDEADADYNPAVTYTTVGATVCDEFDAYRDAVDSPTDIFNTLTEDRLAVLDRFTEGEVSYDTIVAAVGEDAADYHCTALVDADLITNTTDTSDTFQYTAAGEAVAEAVTDIGPDRAVDAFDALRVEGRYDMLSHIDRIQVLTDLQDVGLDASSGSLTQWKDRLVDAGLVEQEGYGRGASYHRTPDGGAVVRLFDQLDADAPDEVARTLQSDTRLELFGVADGASAAEAADQRNASYQSAITYLTEMEEAGLLFRESETERRYAPNQAVFTPTMRFLDNVADSIGIHSMIDGLVVTEEQEERGPVFVGDAAEEAEPQERTKDEMYSGYDGGFGN